MGLHGTKGYVSTVIDQMDQEFDASILVEHLACSNMSIPNSMTIPAPTFHGIPYGLWDGCLLCVVHLESKPSSQ